MTSVRGAEEELVLPGARTGREPERSLRPGPRRLTPEQVASRQRERLLDGVARTVAANGYTGARISDICRAAGVTRPVFYELFSGKEDAVLAAFRGGTETVLRAMQRAYEETGGAVDWPGAVRGGLGVLLGLLARNPAFATMVAEIESVGPAGAGRAPNFWPVFDGSSPTPRRARRGCRGTSWWTRSWARCTRRCCGRWTRGGSDARGGAGRRTPGTRPPVRAPGSDRCSTCSCTWSWRPSGGPTDRSTGSPNPPE
ncbi:TetR/AcrR family transcriptional regulator [Streptomyces sp. SBR177]